VDTQTVTKGGNGKPTREAAEAAAAALSTLPKPVAAHTAGSSPIEQARDLKNRVVWICRMPYGGSRMLAAAFCSRRRRPHPGTGGQVHLG
jgi:hypothetical protein